MIDAQLVAAFRASTIPSDATALAGSFAETPGQRLRGQRERSNPNPTRLDDNDTAGGEIAFDRREVG